MDATGEEIKAAATIVNAIWKIRTRITRTVSTFTSTGQLRSICRSRFFVGPVGYVYDQLSCDSGSGDRVGCFESRVVGIGLGSRLLCGLAAGTHIPTLALSMLD